MRILAMLILVFLLGCNKDKYCDSINGHLDIVLINRSTSNLCFIFYWNFPDTIIGEYNPINDGTDGVEPDNSMYYSAGRNSCWEELLKDDKKEWLYIFNRDTLKSVDWSVVRATNRGLLERRLINLNYLQANNFNLTYP